MAVAITLYGVGRTIPNQPDTGWGEMTQVVVDLATGVEHGTFLSVGEAIAYQRSVTQVVAANDTVNPTRREIRLSAASAVTLSASTAVAAGAKDGQLLTLRGGSSPVTILHGANVQLNGNCVLSLNEYLELEWDATQADWLEVGRSN